MKNVLVELTRRALLKRAANQMSTDDARKRADDLIQTHRDDRLWFDVTGKYVKITQCICPLGNPKPIFNIEYLRKDQLTDDQLNYILQHLG